MRDDLAGELMRLLAADHGRFVLLLGDFGRGKTFALGEVARRIPSELPHLTPIFIEPRRPPAVPSPVRAVSPPEP
ncbi:hypothetical protein AB0M95_11830 [Sphaerisporangium sp. NPDC051017]|uniref:hypothetical protein n=1 Tax=Sphaerisporangium sp. NPDC051017 TaxID=3154636 RepID=UPI00343B00E5